MRITLKLYPDFRLLFLLVAACVGGFSARATINVVAYWHLGESDSSPVSGGFCTNTVDSITGTNTLAFSTSGGVYPVYTASVAGPAALDTGTALGLTLTNGQYGTGSLATTNLNNFGIECWVNPGNTNSSYGGQVLAYNGQRDNGWGLYQSGTNFEVLYGGEAFLGPAGAATARVGVWTHLALICSNGISILFTNGVAAFSTSEKPFRPTATFTLGGDAEFSEFFEGSIDEVRVFTFTPDQFTTNDLLLNQTPVYTFTSPTNFAVGATNGTASLNLVVSPSNACWTAVAYPTYFVNWLHPSNTFGSGSGTILFNYDANPGYGYPSGAANGRQGTMTIAGQTITVTQAVPTYAFSGPNLNYSAIYGSQVFEVGNAASTNTVALTTSPQAQWFVSSGAPWIHLNDSGTPNVGSGNITLTVDPNTETNPATVRHGAIVVYDLPSYSYVSVLNIFQQAAPAGVGETTYQFTGRLQDIDAVQIPPEASPALLSVSNTDVFFLTLSLVTNSPWIYYDTHPCAVNYATFSVPSRGLVYSSPFEDLSISDDPYNHDSLFWTIGSVDFGVTLTFWARDFTQTALAASGLNVPEPLNLTGFHIGESFDQVWLNGDDRIYFQGDLVPMPNLYIQPQPGSNNVFWVTSDATYTPTLQTSYSLGADAVWQTVTNLPLTVGLTNTVTLPATNSAQFFRLLIL